MSDPFVDELKKRLRRFNNTERVTFKEFKNVIHPKLFFLKRTDLFDHVRMRLTSMQPYLLNLLGIERFHPVNFVSDKSFYTFGLVVDLRPSGIEDGIYIVNNLDESNSVLVNLDLKHLKRFSLFSGQVIAIKGKNVSGTNILVESVECIVPLASNRRVDSKKYDQVYTSKPLEIITASGPYSEDGVNFDPLDLILSDTADVIILHGPFVTTPSSALTLSPDDVFRTEVLRRVSDWIKGKESRRAILIPDLDDVLSLKVLPQVAIPTDYDSDRIISLSNPSMFFINEFLFATTSTDILTPIVVGEIYRDDADVADCGRSAGLIFRSGDKIDRVCHHLVFQKNFVPVLPVPYPVSFADASTLTIDAAPDFFILSSKVVHFYKKIGSTNLINHGRSKKLDGKFYSKIEVCGLDRNIEVSFHKFKAS